LNVTGVPAAVLTVSRPPWLTVNSVSAPLSVRLADGRMVSPPKAVA
jgi:hypothetical protein